MTIKKTLSTLCLLATTALAGTPTYTPAGSITGIMNTPRGLATDSSGNLYVARTGANSISVFDSNRNLKPSISGGGLNRPVGLAISGNKLYAANFANGTGTTVSVFNTNDGTLSSTITIGGGISGPWGLAVSGNSLYVADFYDGKIHDLNSTNGMPINGFTNGEVNGSGSGIAIFQNTLYVGNITTGKIFTFNAADGTLINSNLISGLNFPTGLAIDTQGYLYVVNSGDNTVGVYKTDGTFVTSFGSQGTGNDQFNDPQFVTISPNGQYLYVSDSINNRVQIFLIGYPASPSSGAQGVIREIAQDFGIPAFTSNDMVATFIEGARGKVFNAISLSAVQDVTTSTVKAMMPGTQITNFGGGPAATIANTVLGGAFDVRTADRSASFNSFTPIQKQKFSYLAQQLPFLQFQSAQSLAEPIATPVNYATAATPFEQPKMTLKPVFLANEKSHIWIQPYGGLQRLESYDQVTGLSFKTGGTAFGVGHYVSDNAVMGVLTGGALSSYSQDQSSGTGSIDNAYLGLYGGYAKPEGGLNVDGSLIYGQSRYTAERNINALGLIAKNSHRGWDASTRVQVGYKVYYDSLSVDPFVALGYRHSYQNSYQETNAYPFNLTIPSSTNKTANVEIGTKLQQTLVVNDVLVKPLLGLSVLREHPVSKQANANISFSDSGNSFAVPVSTQIKTYATATIGCALMFTNDISISTLVTGKIKKHEKSVEALVKVSYAF